MTRFGISIVIAKVNSVQGFEVHPYLRDVV